MNIYQLTPTASDYAGWKHSRYRGKLIIRAEDEGDARKIALQTLLIGGECRLDKEVVFCPWDAPEVVSCEIFSDFRFPSDGRREVLFPPEWDIEFPDSPKCRREK